MNIRYCKLCGKRLSSEDAMRITLHPYGQSWRGRLVCWLHAACYKPLGQAIEQYAKEGAKI